MYISQTDKAWGVAILIRKGMLFKFVTLKTDNDGRYIMVSGKMHSLPITLVNIYAPNYDKPDLKKTQTNLIIGGDFNFVLDL